MINLNTVTDRDLDSPRINLNTVTWIVPLDSHGPMTNARALRLRGRIVRRARPCGDGAPWEIWAAGASSPAGGSSLSGHPAAAVPAGDDGRGISALCLFQPGPGGNQRDTLDSPWGFWSPPLHIMGFCGRPGGDPNAWKHSGSGQTRAVEP